MAENEARAQIERALILTRARETMEPQRRRRYYTGFGDALEFALGLIDAFPQEALRGLSSEAGDPTPASTPQNGSEGDSVALSNAQRARDAFHNAHCTADEPGLPARCVCPDPAADTYDIPFSQGS